METGRYPNKLRMFRHCQGYSQKKVALLLGLADTSTLSRWEGGIVFPNLLQVFRLARMYHAQPNELYDALWLDVLADKNLLIHHDDPFSNNQFLDMHT